MRLETTKNSADVRRLTLYCRLEPSSVLREARLERQKPTPVQLESLCVILSESSLPVIHSFVSACLAESLSKISGIYDGHNHMSVLLPLASTITSCDLADWFSSPFAFQSVAEFLHQAVNLEQLSVVYDNRDGLSQIYSSLNCHVQRSKLGIVVPQ